MNTSNTDFIRFLIREKALLLGEFKTKSGRQSPYFLNFGCLHQADSLRHLSMYYAHWITAHLKNKTLTPFNTIFGPAYKGIPLAIALTLELGQKKDGLKGAEPLELAYTFNRKEIKAHGDGGHLVGKPLSAQSRILIVDDVLTSGLSAKEAVEIIKKTAPLAEIVGILVGVDRMELGFASKQAAHTVLRESLSIPVHSLLNIHELFTLGAQEKLIAPVHLKAAEAYLQKYASQPTPPSR